MNRTTVILAGAASALLLIVFLLLTTSKDVNNTQKQLESAQAPRETSNIAANGDLLIPVADINEIAKFYPYEVDGTIIEILAIQASDGSIRTAFNTCQSCYNSGKGFYIQEGNELICQNCSERFEADSVEQAKGGCNPVPITAEYKTTDEDTITISGDYIAEAKEIFAEWK